MSCDLSRQIGENLIVPPGVKTVDAYGHLVIPGGVDANTNLQAPQKGMRPADDWYHGTRAAISGGTTTISQSLPNAPSTSAGGSLYSSSTALCNGSVSQLTMCWWSPGTVCCWCLTSGRRRLSREPAATSLCTWTSHAGTTGCWRRWRRWSKIKVGCERLHFLSLHSPLSPTKNIVYFRIQ